DRGDDHDGERDSRSLGIPQNHGVFSLANYQMLAHQGNSRLSRGAVAVGHSTGPSTNLSITGRQAHEGSCATDEQRACNVRGKDVLRVEDHSSRKGLGSRSAQRMEETRDFRAAATPAALGSQSEAPGLAGPIVPASLCFGT